MYSGVMFLQNNNISRLNKNPIAKFFNNTSYFRFALLTALFMTSLCVTEQFFYFVHAIIMVWSVWLFGNKLIRQRYIQKIRYRKLMYFFLGSGLITVLIHSEKNFLMNLYMLYWSAVCFFLFYGLHAHQSNFETKKEIKLIAGFFSALSTVVMAAGLVLLAVFPNGFSYGGYDFCVHNNRFVGIISNANITGFYSAVAIIGLIIIWKMQKAENTLNIRKKVFYTFAFVINLIALFLSDSNAALVFLITFICFVSFYKIFRDFKAFNPLSFLLRLIATILACVVISSLLLFLRTASQNSISLMMTNGQSETKISSSIKNKKNPIAIEEPEPVVTFEHENKNIDSGRFVIWKQAVELFERFPVMGIGQANIVDYGKEYLGGLKYNYFHNGLLTILVSFGIVGFNIFMILAITVAKALFKAIFRYKDKCTRDGDILVLITAFCVAYCVYSMFEITLLLNISFKVIIFWEFIGFGLSYVSKYQNEQQYKTLKEKSFSSVQIPVCDTISSKTAVAFSKRLNERNKKHGFTNKLSLLKTE